MRRILIYLFELIMMFAVFVVCDMPGTIKYAVVALLSILFLLLGRKKKWSAESLICVSLPMIVYLMIGGFTSLINASAYSFTVKIFLFWLIPFLFAFSLYVYYGKDMLRIVDMQFWGCCIIYAVSNIRFIIENGFAESVFAFVFGMYIIYYAYRKCWSKLTIAMVLMYCSEKRIAMLAVLAARMVMMILWLFRNHKKLALIIWGTVTVFVLFYIWAICSGTLAYFCQGIGINTNGRIKMYTSIVEWFGNSAIVLGNGLGIVEKLLEYWILVGFNNLPNDLLKFYLEIGIVGLSLYLLSYGTAIKLIGNKFGNKTMSLFLVIGIYTIALFATDNVSIYIIYVFPMYSIYFAVLSAKKQEEITQVYDKKNI